MLIFVLIIANFLAQYWEFMTKFSYTPLHLLQLYEFVVGPHDTYDATASAWWKLFCI